MGSVVEAVEHDLALIRQAAPELAESALAASLLVLAGELDNSRNSATSKSMCARALLDTMEKLRELVPPGEEEDSLDELRARRAARIGSSAA